MVRRRLTSWLFALALLFGQMGALAHAASHLSKPDSGLPDSVCTLCLAQHTLGAGAAATPLQNFVSEAVHVLPRWNAFRIISSRPLVARARAPPAAV